MPSWTVREWDKLSYGDGDGQIPEKFADQLAATARRRPFGKDGVLEHGRSALRARGVAGILAARDCSLEILPKIDVPPGETPGLENAAVRKRLIHMLAVARGLKIDPGAITEHDWQNKTLLEILIRIFCDNLTEVVRKGMQRRYLEWEDDLPALRGRLDVVRQFTRRAVDPSRLSCRFDVLSEDIPLNRIMKAAVLHLARLSRSWDNQRRLRELAFIYADITDVPPAALLREDITIDRTNRRWRGLLDTARLFLRNRYQTTTGGAGQGTALLFDMGDLFEKYVGRMVRRGLAESDLDVSLQGGRFFCLTDEATRREFFQTKPDILIRSRRTGRVVHVIDTKWKRISSPDEDAKRGVSQGDVYQMMAYAQLYHAPRLTLLYPHHSGLGGKEGVHGRYKITGHETTLEVASLDVAKDNNAVLGQIRDLFGGEIFEGAGGDLLHAEAVYA